MSLLHRLDLIATFLGWHRNPWGRRIERALWRALEDDMAEFRAGRLL